MSLPYPLGPCPYFAKLRDEARACKDCPLSASRTQVVFDDHDDDEYRNAYIGAFFILGEAPGEDEDVLGSPFVGRSGALLNDALDEAKKARAGTYITNVVKCRPPENRPPTSAEQKACQRFLLDQLDLVQPPVVLTLGDTATRALLGWKYRSLTHIRGKVFEHRLKFKVVPTWHPAYILRQLPAHPARGEFFADLAKAVKLWRSL